ncbi:MAG TPA: alpha/beta hydrolase [Thermodesulfobacteriota bacterium]|nr:alpha/beta hydrolase [Thermodesulfobacteriota bacterium]
MEKSIDNNITLFYDTFGSPGGRPLLLIMGIGSQMIAWPEAFCRALAENGHWVIRFDNRDVGLSTKIDWMKMPSFKAAEEAYNEGRPVKAPYNLADMGRDGIGLLNELNIAQAHVCGLSLGGMIAQTMAIEFPARFKSLISMQSSPSDKTLPPPTAEALNFLMTIPPLEREAYCRHMGRAFKAFSGGSPFYDEAMEIEIAQQSYDRCFYPPGFGRQYLARLASGSRKFALHSVRTPSLVIHGDSDTLLPPEHGLATAEAIPDSRWLLVEGLGHGLSYPKLWPILIKAITDHTKGLD